MAERYIQFHHLLTKYNPRFTALRATKMKEEIAQLYDMSTSTVKIDDVQGWYKGGCSVEDLTIRILDKKANLAKYLQRIERDNRDYQEAVTRVNGNNFIAVLNYQKTGKLSRNDIHHINMFIKALQQVRDEHEDKGYQCLEDYEELTQEEVQLLSGEIDRLTEYDIDFKAMKKEHFIKYWQVGEFDTETKKEMKEFNERVKAGDPEAVELYEHKKRFKEKEILIAQADYRARVNERTESSSVWID